MYPRSPPMKEEALMPDGSSRWPATAAACAVPVPLAGGTAA